MEEAFGIGTRLLVGRRSVLNDKRNIRRQEHGLEVIEGIVGWHDDDCILESLSDSWCRMEDQESTAIALTTTLGEPEPD